MSSFMDHNYYIACSETSQNQPPGNSIIYKVKEMRGNTIYSQVTDVIVIAIVLIISYQWPQAAPAETSFPGFAASLYSMRFSIDL